MTALNGNNPYLTIDGTDVTAYWVSLDITYSQSSQDVTAGGNTDHVELAEGLNNDSGSLTIIYDTSDIATYETLLKPGIHTLDYGPEGNTGGKPEHTQSIHIGSAAMSQQVTKTLVQFTCSWAGAAAPTKNILNGDTF